MTENSDSGGLVFGPEVQASGMVADLSGARALPADPERTSAQAASGTSAELSAILEPFRADSYGATANPKGKHRATGPYAGDGQDWTRNA